jgi:predicted membrane chloride channel (bestrophin family)
VPILPEKGSNPPHSEHNLPSPASRASEAAQGRAAPCAPAVPRAAMTIHYDAGSMIGWLGFFKLILRWKGTVLHGAILGPMFWVIMLMHIFFNFLLGALPFPGYTPLVAPTLAWPPAIVGITLLFFFIVFYGNASYARFYEYFGHCVGIGARTMEWAALVKDYSTSLPDAERTVAMWNCMRLMLAANHLIYYTLHGEGISDDEWELIIMRDLLTDDEVEKLRRYKGLKPFIAICWGVDHAKSMLRHEANRHFRSEQAEEIAIMQFREVAFKFRGHCGQILNLLKQPVPFPYFHLLNLIMFTQLSILSYAFVGVDDLSPGWSLALLAFITVVLLGMRGLAVQLSNPFGNDEVDFEIETFMKGSYVNAVAHLREPDLRADACSAPSSSMRNPLATHQGSEIEKAMEIPWDKRPENVGEIRDDDRVLTQMFVKMRQATSLLSEPSPGDSTSGRGFCRSFKRASTRKLSSMNSDANGVEISVSTAQPEPGAYSAMASPHDYPDPPLESSSAPRQMSTLELAARQSSRAA